MYLHYFDTVENVSTDLWSFVCYNPFVHHGLKSVLNVLSILLTIIKTF